MEDRGRRRVLGWYLWCWIVYVILYPSPPMKWTHLRILHKDDNTCTWPSTIDHCTHHHQTYSPCFVRRTHASFHLRFSIGTNIWRRRDIASLHEWSLTTQHQRWWDHRNCYAQCWDHHSIMVHTRLLCLCLTLCYCHAAAAEAVRKHNPSIILQEALVFIRFGCFGPALQISIHTPNFLHLLRRLTSIILQLLWTRELCSPFQTAKCQ